MSGKHIEKQELRMLTTGEAAERLGAAQVSIRVWCQQGRFPNAKHFGRDWMIPETDLAGFEKRDRGRPPKQAGNKPEQKGSKKRSK